MVEKQIFTHLYVFVEVVDLLWNAGESQKLANTGDNWWDDRGACQFSTEVIMCCWPNHEWNDWKTLQHYTEINARLRNSMSASEFFTCD